MSNIDNKSGILIVESNSYIRQSTAEYAIVNKKNSNSVSSTGEAIEYLRKKNYDLLILHVEGLYAFKFLEICRDKYSEMKIILIISENFPEYVHHLTNFPEIQHIIALRPTLSKDELLSTISLIFDNALFKIENITQNTPETLKIDIEDSKEKEKYIQTASKFLEAFNLSSRLIRSILSTMDELIMNIIFNAPVNEKGEHIYKDIPRKEQVILKDTEKGVLNIYYSRNYIGLSACDPFGSIEYSTIIKHLDRCFTHQGKIEFNEDAASTGLGLYQMYQYSDYFIVSTDPKKSTEFLILFDLKIKDRLRSKYSKSLHFFEKN